MMVLLFLAASLNKCTHEEYNNMRDLTPERKGSQLHSHVHNEHKANEDLVGSSTRGEEKARQNLTCG